MISDSTLSRAALTRLAFPAGKGGRHQEIIGLSCEMVRKRLDAFSIFSRLRQNYEPDVSDREIQNAIRWAERTVGRGISHRPSGKYPINQSPLEAVQRFLKGRTAEPVEIWESSPIRPPENWQDDTKLLLSSLYGPEEKVNIVSNSINGRPVGKGRTFTAGKWIAEIESGNSLSGDAGVWVRMNPLNGNGISDNDVRYFRFLLLEFDNLPLEIQLSVFGFLPVPINALITSGSRSIHAWVRLDAASAEDYRNTAGKVFQLLTSLGIDRANRNPSRLSRLPGVKRGNTGKQRLLFLDPTRNKSISIL